MVLPLALSNANLLTVNTKENGTNTSRSRI